MYYFIGIENEKMSALAIILSSLGFDVSGSLENFDYFTVDKLKESGIKLSNFNKDNIKPNMFIVKSEEIKTNEEVEKALLLGFRIYSYQDIVCKLTRMFQTITIAGSYGKTTTSAMMTNVLKSLDNINYLIGDGTGFASKSNKKFVIEAADYNKSFINYTSYYAIITSIDFKNDDYFEDINDVINSYERYANNAEKMVIACGDNSYTHSLRTVKPIFYYGTDEDNDIIAQNIEYTNVGTTFDVMAEGNYYGHFSLPLFGKHQLLDALAVISVCYYERYEAKAVNRALKNYQQPKRRFVTFENGSNVIIDDNAFYPLEIKATIKAAMQKYNDKKLVIVFDPCNGLNYLSFKDDFNKVLSEYDNVYIFNKYDGINFDSVDIDKLKSLENTVILFMGSNDIIKLEKELLA